MIGLTYLIRLAVIFGMLLSNVGAAVSILAGGGGTGTAMGRDMVYGSAILFLLLALSIAVIYHA